MQKEEAQHEEPIYPMPIKATPYQHQVRAFNFAMHQFIQDHEKACAFLMDMETENDYYDRGRRCALPTGQDQANAGVCAEVHR